MRTMSKHNTKQYLLPLMAGLVLAGCPDNAASPDAGAPGRAFWSPQGIAATSTHVLVVNTALYLKGASAHFDHGFVTIIDRKTRAVVGRVETTQPNPQHVVLCQDRWAVVVNTGTYVTKQHVLQPSSGGGVDLLDISAGIPTKVSRNIPLGLSKHDPRVGAYGTVVVDADCKTAYIGSGTRGDVFAVDLQAGKVLRGPDKPIALFPTAADNNGLTTVRPWQKGLAVLDFNSEQLCLSDDWSGQLTPRTCSAIKIKKDLLAGPIDVVRDPNDARGRALVLMSMANALYSVDVTVTPFALQGKLATTGLANNRIVVHQGAALILNSLSANMQRVELPGGKSTLPFTVFPTKSNPYDMVVTSEPEGDVAWVTLSKAHAVALVQLKTGKIITVLGNPSGDAGPGDSAAPDSPAPDLGQDSAASDAAAGEALAPDGGGGLVGIHSVVSASYGAGAGMGQAQLPGVVQGGPQGGGMAGGSTDVLSLGVSGSLVVDFGAYDVVDGPGPDLIVFENAFEVSPYNSYAEPAHVGLSAAGSAAKDFTEFPCDLTTTTGDPKKKTWPHPGCAGVRPVLANVKTNKVSPTDAAKAGGDAYDLSQLGLSQARYLRLRDAGISKLGANNKGFDLDAVVLINYVKAR